MYIRIITATRYVNHNYKFKKYIIMNKFILILQTYCNYHNKYNITNKELNFK